MNKAINRIARIIILLVRIYLGALLAAPLALIGIDRLVGLNKTIVNPFASLPTLFAWSAILFVGAIIVGLPLAVFIVRHVNGFLWRLVSLVLAGAVGSFVVMTLWIGNMAIFTVPAGAATAFACTILNYDRLRERNVRVL